MENIFEIHDGNQLVGEMTWEKVGMTYILNAKFRLPYAPASTLYLYLVCADRQFRLGIPSPCENGWCMKKRFSESEFRRAGINFPDCDRVILLNNEPSAKETFEPIRQDTPSQTEPEKSVEPAREVEDAPRNEVQNMTIPNGWNCVENIDEVLHDNVLLPLLRGKSELIARYTGENTMLALPYDILDEIHFTPAFCLMQITNIENKTYFVLTLDKNGWPIPPESSESE